MLESGGGHDAPQPQSMERAIHLAGGCDDGGYEAYVGRHSTYDLYSGRLITVLLLERPVRGRNGKEAWQKGEGAIGDR